jgi:hypothetical protein
MIAVRRLEDTQLKLLQSSTAARRYFRIPSSGSPFFAGRAAELGKMRNLLTSKAEAERRVILWGIGGAGKTQLAVKYAFKYEEEFSAAFFINAASTASFRTDCCTIAKYLKLPEALVASSPKAESTVAQDSVVEAVKDWFTDYEGDWLLIIDNANNLDELDLQKHLPPTRKKGCIIITSQDNQAAGFAQPGSSIEVGEMLPEDAQELFLKRSGFLESTPEQREICLDIVTRLGMLALAVEHAASYVQSTGITLQDYLANLQLKFQNYLVHSSPSSLHKETVKATVSMAIGAVYKRNKMALELLMFLTALDNEAVLEQNLLLLESLPAFRNWKLPTDRDGYLQAKRDLLSFSLIRSERFDDGGVVLSLHSLVHRCLFGLNKIHNQWLLLNRAAAYTIIVTKGKPLDGTYFRHARWILVSATELFQQADHGEPPDELWIMSASLIQTYSMFWGITGLTQELDELAKITFNALNQCKPTDNIKLMTLAVMAERFVTVQYSSSPDAGDLLLREFLLNLMTPVAAEFLRYTHEETDRSGLNVEFRPYSLADVFAEYKPGPCGDILVSILQHLARTYLGRSDGLELGTVYTRLSRLPKSESWMTQAWRLIKSATPLTQPLVDSNGQMDVASCAIIAARDRASGNMDSTLAMLRRIMENNKPAAQAGLFETAVYDSAKLLQRLKRGDEAREILQNLQYPDEQQTELDIARRYKQFYTWGRKAYARSFTSHDEHKQAEAIYKETYKTAGEAFGRSSLSTLHAGLLLQNFYSQPCCLDSQASAELKDTIDKVFEQLYCSRLRITLGEGLFMGKILLAQGGLEEAVEVFELFRAAAERILGLDHSMTKRAEKWAIHARSERSLELRDEQAGRASLKWGCITFTRSLKGIGDAW